MLAELTELGSPSHALTLVGSGGLLFVLGTALGIVIQRSRSRIQTDELRCELAAAQQLIHEQGERVRSYRTEARTDGLTSLPNRRAFDTILRRRVGERRRRKAAVSLLIIDIDNFKQLNDQYGHQAGDIVLRGLSGILSSAMRDSDVVARIGGEEFGAILHHASLNDAHAVAERLRKSIADNEFLVHGGMLHLTVSIGVAETIVGETTDVLYKRADSALYRAKETGRNRVVVHDGTERDTIVADLDMTVSTEDDNDDDLEDEFALPRRIHDALNKGIGAEPHPDSQPGRYSPDDAVSVPFFSAPSTQRG
ncbi:MAG: GGDEF domain-containing protein [Planctomycetota bacterium]|nr:GGDEF domain-containing protein [Planctomycetota bacterium]